MVEHAAVNRAVSGSNPFRGATTYNGLSHVPMVMSLKDDDRSAKLTKSGKNGRATKSSVDNYLATALVEA